jgi:acyl-CoA thioesterase
MARPIPAPEPHPTRPPRDWSKAREMGGFHQESGFTVRPEDSGDGYCTVVGAVEPRHLNINGVVHGGVYATILDTAMGGAVVSLLQDGEITATTSLYVEFLRPARTGARLRARGDVMRRGRHIAFAEGNLFDDEDRRLSQAHGTWYIWSKEDQTWSGRRDRGAEPAGTAAGRRAAGAQR